MTAEQIGAKGQIGGTIWSMKTRIEHFTAGVEDALPPARRLTRGSAALLALAMLCAAATVAFGIWMTTWAQHL